MRHNHPESFEFNPADCMACEYEYQATIARRLRELRGQTQEMILVEASTIQAYAEDNGYNLSNENAEEYAKRFWHV